MVEHASRRAPLHMGRPALLLLCAVWMVSVSARPSLRPSSPEEFRKLLLWAQGAAERGEVQPNYPSPEQLNEVDQVWTKSHKKGYKEDADLIGHPYRPYVESSNFRRHRPTTEEPSSTVQTPSRIVPVDKRLLKKIELTRSKPISETLTYYTDESPDAEKKLETLSHASIVYVDDSIDRGSAPETKKSEISSSQRTVSDEPDRGIPPVWSPPVLVEELVSRLPSYEEYDRNERYSHSILHGFSGF